MELISHNKFANWYVKKTMEVGNLISTSTAAKLLNVKMPYIYQLWKEKKISKYQYDNDPERKNPIAFYSLNEIMKMVCEKEQIEDSKNRTDGEFINLSDYPLPDAYKWAEEWNGSSQIKLKDYIDKKFKEWQKINPEKAKDFKPKTENNSMAVFKL